MPGGCGESRGLSPGHPAATHRRASLNASDRLGRQGYARKQAYLLPSAAPVEARFSGMADILKACPALHLPTGIFDFDIWPSKGGLVAPGSQGLAG